MKKKSNFFRKHHKWIGASISLFILLFSVSGVILNHRKLFSEYDVNRDYLPYNYTLKNWNLASVKSSLKLSDDSILVYGNIGIYLTNHDLSKFQDFNNGFGKGIDNRKVEKVYKTKSGKLLASTIFNLHEYNKETKTWSVVELPGHTQRVVDIAEDNNGVVLITRSSIIKSNNFIDFDLIDFPNPKNYDNKESLFKTIWVFHSGEVYGSVGKLIVDFFGLIFIFMSISGIIYFILPKIIKRKKKKNIDAKSNLKTLKTSFKWHTRIGWSLGVFMFFTAFTGMFLRPPLLIPIATSKIDKVPFTELDTDNAWFDKLRRVIYDEKNNRYYIATIEGVYYSDDNFKSEVVKLKTDVPISVMGVNVFRLYNNKLLIGSFEGLFEVDLGKGVLLDYTTSKPYKKPKSQRGNPIGENMAAGYSDDFSFGEIYFDYDDGLVFLENRKNKKIEMPDEIRNTNFSLWNTSQEVHTMRFFQFAFSDFYILIIPLIGLGTLFVLISGFVMWFKRKNKFF